MDCMDSAALFIAHTKTQHDTHGLTGIVRAEDGFVLKQIEHLAEGLIRTRPGLADQIELAYRSVLNREPLRCGGLNTHGLSGAEVTTGLQMPSDLLEQH